MAKDDIIRFRCESDLKSRFLRVAQQMRRDESDLARIVFEDYVAQEEVRLGITPPLHAAQSAPHPRKTTEEVKAAILGAQTPRKLRHKRSGSG